MTSFASAFGRSDQEDNYSNNIEINSTNDYQGLNNFSNIDLDQQPTLFKEDYSSYLTLNHAAAAAGTFQTTSSSTAGAIVNNPSHSPPFSSEERSSSMIKCFKISQICFLFSGKSFSSNTIIPTDRRISIPDMSKLSASSVAAVAAMGPKFDKFKQWSRSTYKCTKQSIYEKLGKTTRTIDIELDTQIEQFRETKRRYENMLALARSYANNFFNLIQTQKALSK
jgi:hypothetical protein